MNLNDDKNKGEKMVAYKNYMPTSFYTVLTSHGKSINLPCYVKTQKAVKLWVAVNLNYTQKITFNK